MRRTLWLIALGTFGLATAMPAQARAVIGARLLAQSGRSPDLVVNVTNFLDEPRWVEALQNAYPIQLHWRAQLWQSRALIDRSLPPIEWDVVIQQVPVVDVFRFTERIGNRSRDTSFSTFDALKAYVEGEVQIPTPRLLVAGRWYYTVDLHIAALTQEQLDRRNAPQSLSWLQELVLGSGPSADLSRQKTVLFVVPPR